MRYGVCETRSYVQLLSGLMIAMVGGFIRHFSVLCVLKFGV